MSLVVEICNVCLNFILLGVVLALVGEIKVPTKHELAHKEAMRIDAIRQRAAEEYLEIRARTPKKSASPEMVDDSVSCNKTESVKEVLIPQQEVEEVASNDGSLPSPNLKEDFSVHAGRRKFNPRLKRRPGPARRKSNNNSGFNATAVMHMQRALRPMRNPVHSYSRMASIQFAVYQNGFNGLYNDMSFSFGLTAIQQYSGTALITSTAIPGSADFQNLYSLWKITGVETSILFSCNVAQVESVSVATYTLPLIYYATVPNSDYKNTAPTVSTIEQNQQCRVCQLGNIRSASGLVFGFKPVLPEDPNGVVVNNKSWVDINTGAEYYNSLQMVMDPFGATSNVFLGYMKLSFRIHYSLVNSG